MTAKPYTISVYDQEVVTEIEKVAPGERDRYLSQALRVGVIALRAARGDIDAHALKERLDAALTDLDHRLAAHDERFMASLGASLATALAPETGQLDRQLSGAALAVQEVLAEHGRAVQASVAGLLQATLGPGSSFSRIFDETSTGGIANQIFTANKILLEKFQEKVSTEVVGQFSLDDPQTALSRLKRIVDETRQALVREFSLDNRDGALARLYASIGERITALAADQAAFQGDVRAALAASAARDNLAARTTAHGVTYETAVGAAFARVAGRFNHLFDETGTTTGLIKNCKVGDFLIELDKEGAAPGARIVVEAKASVGYQSIIKVTDEGKTARDNRGAAYTIFVIDPSYAPDAWPALNRYGETVVVKWRPDDDDTLIFAALSICAGLCVLAERKQEGLFDSAQLERSALEVQRRAQTLDDVTTWAQTIQAAAAKILDRVRIAGENLRYQAETLLDEVKKLRGAP